ncbi:uncharacterized protein LOC142556856 [Primulina tabacum]|uniref:uncharacterized protein LOC142556856 n=1 Tax=Primulina tabacum TaxID=48773 RepID=UPI003F5A6F22
MDAYQGYRQILLAEYDQDKASFITSGGTFCYVVMPFRLKNVETTYQRLMNRVFEKQLARNVEVYVDDILGKSKEVAGFVSDLEETFATLMQYVIKVNPAKCIFGIKSGKFLGFVVTDRGIEVNQEKVKPLGRIMTHSEVSGRIIKWTVELGEYNIGYEPWVPIKAQDLSDFLSEMVQPDEEKVWRVFFDRASSLSGCAVGVVIIALPGEKIKLALIIDSRVTDNETEYEAVLTGISTKVLIYERGGLCPPGNSLKDVAESISEEQHWPEKPCLLDFGGLLLAKTLLEWFGLVRVVNIIQIFNTARHPHEAYLEVVNRIIVQALKTRLQGKGKDWVEELRSVLWAYRTTPREPIQETPFNLVYGSEAVLSVEIGQSSARVESYPDDNTQSRAMELDLVEEKIEHALIRMEAYRGRVIKSNNKRVRIRHFQVGDLVMKKVNPAGDVGKLEARWKRPFKIT